MLSELEVKLQLGLEQLAAIDNRTKAIKRLVRSVEDVSSDTLELLDGDEEEPKSVQQLFDKLDEISEELKDLIDTKVNDAITENRIQAMATRDQVTEGSWGGFIVVMLVILFGHNIIDHYWLKGKFGEIRGAVQTKAERP